MNTAGYPAPYTHVCHAAPPQQRPLLRLLLRHRMDGMLGFSGEQLRPLLRLLLRLQLDVLRGR